MNNVLSRLRWQAFFGELIGPSGSQRRRSWGIFFRVIEFMAVIIDVIAVILEFQVEKPKERDHKKKQLFLLADIVDNTNASLQTTVPENQERLNVNPAVRSTIEFLESFWPNKAKFLKA